VRVNHPSRVRARAVANSLVFNPGRENPFFSRFFYEGEENLIGIKVNCNILVTMQIVILIIIKITKPFIKGLNNAIKAVQHKPYTGLQPGICYDNLGECAGAPCQSADRHSRRAL
jgi:hypothetical protein